MENNHQKALGNTDVVSWEYGTDGFPPTTNLPPAETTDTVFANGYYFWDTDIPAAGYKTAAYIQGVLATANASRAVYLLNIAPDTTGAIPATQLALLAAIGAPNPQNNAQAFLQPAGINGSAILGTI